MESVLPLGWETLKSPRVGGACVLIWTQYCPIAALVIFVFFPRYNAENLAPTLQSVQAEGRQV